MLAASRRWIEKKEISCNNWLKTTLPNRKSPGCGEEVLCCEDRQKRYFLRKKEKEKLVKSGRDQITRNKVHKSCWGLEVCKMARGENSVWEDGSHGWVEEQNQGTVDLFENLFLTLVNQVRFKTAESLIEYKYTVNLQ